MLKIAAPFQNKDEVLSLIQAGANELYCGYLAPEWEKSYTSLEFERKGGKSNFQDIRELKEAVDLAHGKNTPVFLALNGLYVKKQYPLLLKIIDRLNKIKFDSYIVADLGLLLTLRKQGLQKKIHISTGGTVFNSAAVDFYKNLGASRIVLDRQTSIESMRALAQENPALEFEVFILNNLCVYIDGFCNYLHTYGRESHGKIIQKNTFNKERKLNLITTYDPFSQADACTLVFSCLTKSLKTKKNLSGISPIFYKHLVDGVECGACAIYEISKTKIKVLKIVGRQLTPMDRLKDVKFIRSALNLLDSDITHLDYMKQVQSLYRKTYRYPKTCRGNNCYYPEANRVRD